MKTLLLMRHAKSSWEDESLKDHDRPLNRRGRNAAPRMARWARHQDCLPDQIISSTALRALSTAQLFVDHSQPSIELLTDKRLYHAAPEDMAEVSRELAIDADCLMLVGHNPGMQSFVSALTGEWESMPTAALARIAVPIDQWLEFQVSDDCELLDIWRPKEIPEEFE